MFFSCTVLCTTSSASLRPMAMHLRRHGQDQCHASLSDALTEIHQITRVAGEFPLKVNHPAKLLPIRVHFPAINHALIAFRIHLLEQKQSHHQAHRLRRSSFRAVVLREGFLKTPPRDSICKIPQGMPWIALLGQCGEKERRLMNGASLRFHALFISTGFLAQTAFSWSLFSHTIRPQTSSYPCLINFFRDD